MQLCILHVDEESYDSPDTAREFRGAPAGPAWPCLALPTHLILRGNLGGAGLALPGPALRMWTPFVIVLIDEYKL